MNVLHLGMQMPVRDEVSNEDAAQYLVNPVTGALALRMSMHTPMPHDCHMR